MANKKAIVSKQNLPPVNSENGYRVRYRIISEDRNRVSHWSPIYTVESTPIEQVAGVVTYADGVATIVWDDTLGRPAYDIFIRFDYDDVTNPTAAYVYHGTSNVHNYSIINEGTTRIDVIIQVASTSKELSENLSIYSETVLI